MQAELSPISAPLVLGELAAFLRMRPRDLKRLMKAHGIKPACRVGKTDCFGGRELRQIVGVLASLADDQRDVDDHDRADA